MQRIHVFRVLPYWPRVRFLELCPRDWVATRARLDAAELERELGPITVPEPATAPTSSRLRAERTFDVTLRR